MHNAHVIAYKKQLCEWAYQNWYNDPLEYNLARYYKRKVAQLKDEIGKQ